MQIVLYSYHDKMHSIFETNTAAQTTKIVEMPSGVTFDHPLVAPDGVGNLTDDARPGSTHSGQFVPSTGFR